MPPHLEGPEVLLGKQGRIKHRVGVDASLGKLTRNFEDTLTIWPKCQQLLPVVWYIHV